MKYVAVILVICMFTMSADARGAKGSGHGFSGHAISGHESGHSHGKHTGRKIK